jgi:hypothetical protein
MSGEVEGMAFFGYVRPVYVVEPKYPYCGVEFMERGFLKDLDEYLSHPTQFLLGINESLPLGQFIQERQKVLEDDPDYIISYPCYCNGKPKKPAKRFNENKIYELKALDMIKRSRINQQLTMKDIIFGVKMGLERHKLEESIDRGLEISPEYHTIVRRN